MRKLAITLLVVFILMAVLAACTPNNNGDNGTGTGSGTSATTATTTKNDGMVSDTGTDTNIIDKIESDIVGTDTTAKK